MWPKVLVSPESNPANPERGGAVGGGHHPIRTIDLIGCTQRVLSGNLLSDASFFRYIKAYVYI